MNSHKIIVFDAFGTLFYKDKKSDPSKEIIEYLHKQNIDKATISQIFNTFMSGDDDMNQIFASYNIKEVPSQTILKWNEYFIKNASTIKTYSDTLPVLKYLLNNDYHIVIASNLIRVYSLFINGIIASLYSDSDISKNHTIKTAYSFEINSVKPQKEFFKKIMLWFPEHNYKDFHMIGDRYEDDIRGSQQCGWSSFLLKRSDMSLWAGLPP